MSTFAGTYNFNQRPIGDCQRESLTTLWRLAERTQCDKAIVVEGPIGACYRSFPAADESRSGGQPMVGRNHEVVVGSLRLDNREELIRSLRSQLHGCEGQISDIALVLAAYERWGELFPLHLVGEFALALYDPNARKCFLTRDHIGARPLYYHYDNDKLIFGSDLELLLETAGISLVVNDDFVAGYLMYDPDPQLTAFRNVKSVTPFHTVTFDVNGRERESRYWDLAALKPVRHRTDAEYEEEFRFHFSNGVSGPLRTTGCAFSDLSGGLDSSSIVCMAQRLIESGQVQAQELITVSLVSSDSPTSDQTKYIRYVEEHIGRKGYHIDECDYSLFSTMSIEKASLGLNPLLFCEAKHRQISKLMDDANAGVILCGIGGDEITCGQQNATPELADLLVTLRFRTLHERLKAWSGGTKQPYLSLLSDTVGTLLPHTLRARKELRTRGTVPDFLKPKFVKEFSLKNRHLARDPFGCGTPSEIDQATGFWTASRAVAAGYRGQLTRGYISYPFLARPLVEYMQAIPHTQRVRLGERRSLMRRALKDVLPAAIVKRRGKGNPQETVARSFAREWSRLKPFLKNSRLASYGYVDEPLFLSAIEQYRLGKSIHLAMLLKLLALEFWLRRLEGHQGFSRISHPLRDSHLCKAGNEAWRRSVAPLNY